MRIDTPRKVRKAGTSNMTAINIPKHFLKLLDSPKSIEFIGDYVGTSNLQSGSYCYFKQNTKLDDAKTVKFELIEKKLKIEVVEYE